MNVMFRLLVLGSLILLSPHVVKAQEPGSVELSAYIENLRQQFIQLAGTGDTEKLPLYVSPIEIELTVAVVNAGSAGIKFYVLDASGSITSSSTQKLKFTVAIGDPTEPFMASKPPLGIFPYAGITRVPSPAELEAYTPTQDQDIKG